MRLPETTGLPVLSRPRKAGQAGCKKIRDNKSGVTDVPP
jgi:hypothetical protein